MTHRTPEETARVVFVLIGAGRDLDAGAPSARDTAAMSERLDLLG
jgi:hypothetical protein